MNSYYKLLCAGIIFGASAINHNAFADPEVTKGLQVNEDVIQNDDYQDQEFNQNKDPIAINLIDIFNQEPTEDFQESNHQNQEVNKNNDPATLKRKHALNQENQNNGDQKKPSTSKDRNAALLDELASQENFSKKATYEIYEEIPAEEHYIYSIEPTTISLFRKLTPYKDCQQHSDSFFKIDRENNEFIKITNIIKPYTPEGCFYLRISQKIKQLAAEQQQNALTNYQKLACQFFVKGKMFTRKFCKKTFFNNNSPASAYYQSFDELKLELQNGCSLQKLIEKHPLDKNNKITYLTLLIQIAHGLEFLHQNNIFHGNLRANNIIIIKDKTNKNPLLTAKIIDFYEGHLLDPSIHIEEKDSRTSFKETDPEFHLSRFHILDINMLKNLIDKVLTSCKCIQDVYTQEEIVFLWHYLIRGENRYQNFEACRIGYILAIYQNYLLNRNNLALENNNENSNASFEETDESNQIEANKPASLDFNEAQLLVDSLFISDEETEETEEKSQEIEESESKSESDNSDDENDMPPSKKAKF